MSPPPPRDPRTTQILELPVPGDVDPPDHVTYHGELADRIDQAVTALVPTIEPADLSQPPYNDPYDGMTVDMRVDGVVRVVWRLRYSSILPHPITPGAQGAWACVGGSPLIAQTDIEEACYVANQWRGGFTPIIAAPRPGTYHITLHVVAFGQQTSLVALWVGTDTASQPNTLTATASAPVSPNPQNYATCSIAGYALLLENDSLRVALYNGNVVPIRSRSLSMMPVTLA